jgi:hypothetical protein
MSAAERGDLGTARAGAIMATDQPQMVSIGQDECAILKTRLD